MLLIISNTLFYKRLGRSRKCIHTNLEGVNVFISEIINTHVLQEYSALLFIFLPVITLLIQNVMLMKNIWNKFWRMNIHISGIGTIYGHLCVQSALVFTGLTLLSGLLLLLKTGCRTCM